MRGMPLGREVKNLTTCKRCGDSQVGWYKTKADKWRLFTGYHMGGGTFSVNLASPHKCFDTPLPGFPKP